MRNIQEFRAKYETKLAKKHCKIDNVSLCNKGFCKCKAVAEVLAYRDAIIPEQFREADILNFTGCVLGESVISSEIAIEAKNQLCKYCWGVSWEVMKNKSNNETQIKKFIRNNSLMQERMNVGNNVVIYGNSRKGPIGRTFLASIIMKEAIRLRFKTGQRSQTYDWVDFPTLKDAIHKDSSDVLDYQFCDWLVVDNITNNNLSSLKQKIFLTDIINPFFLSRINNRLPTILVFKFDINLIDMEKDMGIGISNIINSQKTCKISLIEKNYE